MRESEVILFVVDAQDGLTPIDQELARILRKSRKPVVLVINKIDHPKHEDLESDFARLGFANSIPISAAHGSPIASCLETIDSSASIPSSPSPVHQSAPTLSAGDYRRAAERGKIVTHQFDSPRCPHHRERTARHDARCGRHHV
jgi:predicted GTPase